MRKKTQRRLILVLLIAVVGLSVVAVRGGDSGCQIGESVADQSEPEAVVVAAIEAYGTMDYEQVLAYFTPPAGSLQYDRLARLYARCTSVEVGGVATLIISQSELSCKVRAMYDMVLTVGEHTSAESYDKNIRLVRIEGQWYINYPF